MNPYYPFIARRAANLCEHCRAPEIAFNFPHEVEHIVPTAHGGTNRDNNLALSCHACNLHKSAFLAGYDEITQADIRLFHPRLDVWDEHFQFDPVTREKGGLTAVGRATVARLRMNAPAQTSARRLWVGWRIFP